MKLRKTIQKYGSALILRLSKDDIKNYNFKEGQVYDVELIEVVKDGTN